MTARDRLFALEQFGIKLGLDNINTLVTALGRPDRAFPSVHIAGTNGKGSVTAMVERGLRAAGYRTGRYTSPHLVAVEERMAIDGIAVSAEVFNGVTADVLSVVDQLRTTGALPQAPTFFEVTTSIAFEIFRRAHVTAAVIEVGLGGRFDATNVIAPHVTAITSIALDHEKHLGSTLHEIAREKAGIIKNAIPIVIGELPAEAHDVIRAVALSHNAPLIEARRVTHGTPLVLALNGAHQQLNAAVAVEVLRCCAALAGHTTLARDHIVAALTDVDWPARLEWLRSPTFGDVLLDAAHNPAGARALAQYVMSTGGPLPMVIAVMRDKDVEAILRELAPAVSRFVTTTADSPRALPASELAERIRMVLPAIPCGAQTDPAAALHEASRPERRLMLAGSIFLVGPVREQLIAHGATTVRYSSEANLFYLD
jgi:dihydrofolate synthase / folylpolyglutamate synthase